MNVGLIGTKSGPAHIPSEKTRQVFIFFFFFTILKEEKENRDVGSDEWKSDKWSNHHCQLVLWENGTTVQLNFINLAIPQIIIKNNYKKTHFLYTTWHHHHLIMKACI